MSEFLNANEVASFLRLPQSTVYKLAQEKIIPAIKIGKHWRFRKASLNDWLKQQESPIRSQPRQKIKPINGQNVVEITKDHGK